jgi:hypothetical protein
MEMGMSHLSRIFLTLLLIFPSFSDAQEAHSHSAPEKLGQLSFRFPAYRQFSNCSTEVLRCFTRSLTPPPKMHSGA